MSDIIATVINAYFTLPLIPSRQGRGEKREKFHQEKGNNKLLSSFEERHNIFPLSPCGRG
jgi:hypothetical protein